MAITGAQIAARVGLALNDATHVRWTEAEILEWINEGRRQMAAIKPALFAETAHVQHTLTAGCRQRVATPNAYRIESVDSTDTDDVVVRPTTREQLDAFRPTWRADTASAVQNWFSDGIDPLAFWVYPAPTASAVGKKLNLHVLIAPTPLTALTQTAVPYDQYDVPLVHYVMARAYGKDAEAGGNAALAASYLDLFTKALT